MTPESFKKEIESPSIERVVFKNSRGLNLVGDFYQADSKSIIVMSHGITSDRHADGKFDKIAPLLNKEGYNVLRFDFSGSGESDDDFLTESGEIDDLRSALRLVSDRGLTEIGLLGYSFGGLITSRCYDDNIKTIALWAPVTNAAENPEAYYGQEGLKELAEFGFITRVRDNAVRNKTRISRQGFEEWKSVNQEQLLSRVKCETLIVHGNKDTRIPLIDSISAMKHLPSGSKLEIVEDADHHFDQQADTFINFTVDWFKTHQSH